MPLQVYECPTHGDFEITIKFSDKISKRKQCPVQVEYCNPGGHPGSDYHDQPGCGHYQCKVWSPHVARPIAAAIVEGGTGGGKDMHLKR